ncbi:MAG: ABC transporter substrate-binding protein [Proteobacteria bacterium]|nr:ABC transporter substrate-binding protein [Pseudomonadota bacterium]
MVARRITFGPLAAMAAAAGLACMTATAQPAFAQQKLTIALPGVPPVFSTAFVFTAQDAGLYKKYGLDVTLKPMDSGVGAARAVVSGAVDVSLSPTPPVAVMISNAGVPLKVIQGMERPDWLIGSMDASIDSCAKLKGNAVGVDSPRGARWVQLQNMARPCNLLPDRDIPTVNLSTNVGAAMVGGQIKLGVLHLDDVPVIERESGKKVHVVARIEEVAPGTHYLSVVTTKKVIAEKRDALVRMLAANIEAIDMMYNRANVSKVAGYAKPTGRTPDDAKHGLNMYLDFNFWPHDTPGLDQKRVEKSIAIQASIGKQTSGKAGINPEKTPVSYAEFTDLSVWNDAMALRKKMK